MNKPPMNDRYDVNENEMLKLAARLAEVMITVKGNSDRGVVVFLYGSLGVGKTTFCRGFLRGLGYTEKVKSPTYTLVEPYEIEGRDIFHFDLYRLQIARELEQMGIQDYFSTNAISLIEWPEKGLPFLPQPDIACYIEFTGFAREICLQANSELGQKILGEFSSRSE